MGVAGRLILASCIRELHLGALLAHNLGLVISSVAHLVRLMDRLRVVLLLVLLRVVGHLLGVIDGLLGLVGSLLGLVGSLLGMQVVIVVLHLCLAVEIGPHLLTGVVIGEGALVTAVLAVAAL